MKIGSLYEIKKWYWLLFPAKDIAAVADARGLCGSTTATAATPVGYADYWSSRFSCNISCIELNSIFMLLEQDGNYCKIFSTEGSIGWIIYPKDAEWAKGCIEEAKDQ
jgi:hypothetical protein